MSLNENICELCQKESDVSLFRVTPEDHPKNEIIICTNLIDQINKKTPVEVNDWRFLTDSIWSEKPAIQVLSWRMLHRLKNLGEIWAADTLDIAYLEDETRVWAEKDLDEPVSSEGEVTLHKDSNGNILENGDSVVLTKTLDVKGSTLSAKLGTVVKNIRLVEDNHEQIEGKVEGQMIVILTKFLRKQN